MYSPLKHLNDTSVLYKILQNICLYTINCGEGAVYSKGGHWWYTFIKPNFMAAGKSWPFGFKLAHPIKYQQISPHFSSIAPL